MSKNILAHHWLGGILDEFSNLETSYVGEDIEIAIASRNIKVIGQRIGYMKFFHPFLKYEISIDFPVSERPRDCFQTCSKENVYKKVLYAHYNRGKKEEDFVTPNEKDVDYISLRDSIAGSLKTRLPHIVEANGVFKLVSIPNVDCECLLYNKLITSYNLRETTWELEGSYAQGVIDKEPVTEFKLSTKANIMPPPLYNINIQINENSARLVRLGSYGSMTSVIGDILYVTLEERYINAFKIVITDASEKPVESLGNIVLHIKSK
jgi:hypothetical protein